MYSSCRITTPLRGWFRRIITSGNGKAMVWKEKSLIIFGLFQILHRRSSKMNYNPIITALILLNIVIIIVKVLSACKISTLRQFDPLETIYYEDKGQLSYVHFVVSGECMILQCLKMNVSLHKIIVAIYFI